MADSLDSLQIELKSSSQSAVQSINTLISKLGALSGALAGVDTGKISSLAGSVSQLSSAMQGMNAIKTTDFTRLSRNLNSISNISGSTLTTASNNIVQFAKSLESLKNVSISPSAQQITELASAIRVLGLKSATNAISNIPQLSTALVGLMQSLSGAPTVSRNVIDLTNALAQLSSANGRVTSTSTTNKARSFFDTLTSGSNKSTKSVKSLAYHFGKLYANFFIVFRLFRKLGEAINLSSQLTELQNVVDVTFGNMASRLDDMAQTSIQDFGMSELTLKKIASRYQAMGSAMGITDDAVKKSTEYLSSQNAIYDDTASTMADVSIQLTKLTADMASFYDVSQSDVAEDLQSVFTGMTRPLRQYGLDLTQATLQEWALSQGMNANIQTMTQAEKTMLRYQYVMAHTTNAMGDFKRTSDTWANQIRILKQNFQQLAIVIGNTLVQAFKPFVKALNQVMAKVIQFAQTVYNALGKIFGWKMEVGSSGVTDELYGAEDAAGGIEDNLGGASDNAKKLKDNLLGIDELNIISPDIEDTGVSGGLGNLGGVGGASDAAGVEIEKTESLFDSFIDNLYELGEYIRDALISAMESIDWDSVYEKFRGFGKGLAEFLNGLFAYDGEGRTLFGVCAKTLAKTLNAIVYAAQEFAKEFDFYQFGVNLADAINNFFENFDFKAFADTLNRWVDGFWQTLKGFFDKLEWETILDGLRDFLTTIEPDTVITIVGLYAFKKFGKTISAAIKKGIKDEIKKGLAGFSLSSILLPLGSSLGALNTFDLSVLMSSGIGVAGATIATGLCEAILAGIAGFELGKKIGKLISGDTELYESFTWFGDEGFFDTLFGDITTSGNPLKDIVSDIQDMKDAWNEMSDGEESPGWLKALTHFVELASSSITPIGTLNYLIGELGELLDKLGEKLSGFFEEKVAPVFSKENIEEAFSGFQEGISTKWDEFVEWWSNTAVAQWWEEHVVPIFAYESWAELWNDVQLAFSDKWEEFKEWWSTTAIAIWWEEDVKPWFTYEKWCELADSIKKGIKTKWDETAKNWKTDIKTWWSTDVEPWFTYEKWYGILQNVEKAIKDAFRNGVNSAIDSMNNALAAIETTINGFLQGLADFKSKLGVIGEAIQIDFSPISIPRIPHFATGGFPEDGFFYANHNELVGSFNGKNAVVNNTQIVEGIATGIERVIVSTLTPYLEDIADSSRTTANKEFDLDIDYKQMSREFKRSGFAF